MEILPGIGINGLKFGSRGRAILEKLGRPENKDVNKFSDGSSTITWNYDRLGIALSFASEDDWRLDSITIQNQDAKLLGRDWIGLSELELLQAASRLKLNLVLDDDCPELGVKNYECEEFGVTFWIVSNRVESITAMVLFENDDETPIWP